MVDVGSTKPNRSTDRSDLWFVALTKTGVDVDLSASNGGVGPRRPGGYRLGMRETGCNTDAWGVGASIWRRCIRGDGFPYQTPCGLSRRTDADGSTHRKSAEGISWKRSYRIARNGIQGHQANIPAVTRRRALSMSTAWMEAAADVVATCSWHGGPTPCGHVSPVASNAQVKVGVAASWRRRYGELGEIECRRTVGDGLDLGGHRPSSRWVARTGRQAIAASRFQRSHVDECVHAALCGDASFSAEF